MYCHHNPVTIGQSNERNESRQWDIKTNKQNLLNSRIFRLTGSNVNTLLG